MRRIGAPRLLAAAALVACAVFAAAGCPQGPPEPAALDTRNEACAACRMSVSDARFAGQLVAPGELPLFFDDIGCLADFVKAGRAPAGAVAFVADHRTREWVLTERAVYTRVEGLATPMGSHVVAHASAASRDADPDAKTGVAVGADALFAKAAPGGQR